MSQIYVSGPAYVWVGNAVTAISDAYTPSAYSFFGFTERGLNIGTAPKTEDVMVDYSGLMPADVSFLGIDAKVSGTFTRYNEGTLRNLMAALNGVNAGFGPKQSIGTLYQSEPPFLGAGVMAGPPLLVYSPYGIKPEFGTTSASPMIKCMRFYSAYVSENLAQTLSVRRKAPEVTWRAIPAFGSGSPFVPNQAPYDTWEIFAVDESAIVSPLNLPAVD